MAKAATPTLLTDLEVETLVEALRPLHEAVLSGNAPAVTDAARHALHTLCVAVHQDRVDPHVVDEILGGFLTTAAAVVGEGLMALSLQKGAALEHRLSRVGRRRWNVPIGTAAVSRDPRNDEITLFLNPFFIGGLDATWMVAFVLGHEALHLLLFHLWQAVETDPHRAHLRVLSCEIFINKKMGQRFRSGLPTIGGEPTGVDPEKEYAKYREAAKEANLTPVDRHSFFETDESIFQALASLPTPPKPSRSGHVCAHTQQGQGQGQGQSQGQNQGQGQNQVQGQNQGQGNSPQSGSSPSDGGDTATKQPGTGIWEDPGVNTGLGSLDDPGVADRIEEVLLQSVKEALAGNEELREQLLTLGKEFPNSPVWGRIALGALRGEKPVVRQQSYWEQYLMSAIDSHLSDSDRLAWDKKTSWFTGMFSPVGDDEEFEVSVYFDASGSISGPLVERMTALVGQVPRARIRWNSFDTQVYELGVTEEGYPAEVGAIEGGGGTTFLPIYDHVADLEDDADLVIVVTDGYVSHSEHSVTPAGHHRYIWLVTAGGDPWMADLGMSTVVVDENFAAAQ